MYGSCMDSRLVGSSGLTLGSVRLTGVDQPLFLPCGVNCLLEVSSVNVIHCYSVPGLGVKVDAILGRSSLANVTGLVQGYYTGYCAELCGSGHGFMPCGVVVYACFFLLGVICMYLVVASVWHGWSLSSVCSWLLVISRCFLWSVGLLATWSSVGSLLVSGCVMVAYLLLLVLALLV